MKEKSSSDKKKENINLGIKILGTNPIFRELYDSFWSDFYISDKKRMGKESAAETDGTGHIYLNKDIPLIPQEWAYTIAHCMLHNVFGHFDADKMPGYDKKEEDGTIRHIVSCDPDLWNMACDIYVSKFLTDIKFGKPTFNIRELDTFTGDNTDEIKIYERLRENYNGKYAFTFGTASLHGRDMIGLDKPKYYDKKKGESNFFAMAFAAALAHSVSNAVYRARNKSACVRENNQAVRAAQWFINHYPLLGALASCFKIVFDSHECASLEIDVAAVNVSDSIIYVNPLARLSDSQMRFVMAHEFLHAGLCHHERRQGKNPYLWNVACDFS